MCREWLRVEDARAGRIREQERARETSMKVTAVETHLAAAWTFVRVMTDEGVYGVGEVHPASGTGGTPFTARAGIA